MTMENIADEANSKAAFSKVAANRGAAGPDRMSIVEVRERLDEYLSRIQSSLLDGSHRAGEIRRVWIPKKSGGQRGLGIPNVMLTLIRGMLRAGIVMPDGVVQKREGTPQGGPLSPLLSNIVLDELDQELAKRGYRFVRYADDCNVYVKTERARHRVMASLTDFIERKMKLRVNQEKSKVARPKDRQFLGLTPVKGTSGAVRLVVLWGSPERSLGTSTDVIAAGGT